MISEEPWEIWVRTIYPKMVRSLALSRSEDEKSARILSRILTTHHIGVSMDFAKQLIENRTVIVFGGGVSLDQDIESLRRELSRYRVAHVLLAADGAADALYKNDLIPDGTVSDLDSCTLRTLIDQSKERLLCVHSHGDNIDLVRRIVPKLGRNIIGTTQSYPTRVVINTGGFTDGDRACYFACRFGAKKIVLAGMDFGTIEGRHSINKRAGKKIRPYESWIKKMSWGKKSLELLIARRPEIRFFNVTHDGEEIEGAERITYSDFKLRFS